MKKMSHEHHMKAAHKKMEEAHEHHRKAHEAMKHLQKDGHKEKKHMDVKEDKKLVRKMVKKDCMY
jgi:hypothetical protein